jgi:glycogen phosphorylase
MSNLAPEFNTSRMVEEYTRRFYAPASARWVELADPTHTKPADLAAWKSRVRSSWRDVHLVDIESRRFAELAVGETLELEASVSLGELTADDVSVQAYHGVVDNHGEIVDGSSVEMEHVGREGQVDRYEGAVPAHGTGKHGFAIRVIPVHEDLITPYDMGLIVWSS